MSSGAPKSSSSAASLSLPRRPSTPSASLATTLIKSFPVPEPLPFAAELPYLPVPDLEDTLQRYLKSVRPFLNDADFEGTSDCASELLESGVGARLHARLVKRAEVAHKLGQTGYLKDLLRGQGA